MRKLALAAVAVFVLGVAAVPTATSREPNRGTRVPGGVLVRLGPRTWTPEMRRAAKPVTFEPRANGPVAAAPQSQVSTTPTVVGPSRSTAATAGAVPYVRTLIDDPSLIPMHGKFFMQLADGNLAVCSGTVVSSDNLMTGMTAAHCIQNPEDGSFIQAAQFVPAYDQGLTPFGVWDVENAIVTQQWNDTSLVGAPDARYDIAAFSVFPNPAVGMTLQDTVGARGIIFNLDQTQTFTSFGYPAEGDFFDGEEMWSCASQAGGAHLAYEGPPFPNAMGCDMTGGSSGGGWVINDEFVNSVVSYGVDSIPEMQFGPYFGQVGLELYEFVSGTDVPPSNEPALAEHATKITMKLKKHLIAKGKVTVPDGFAACANAAYVGVAKVKGNQAVVIAETFSNPDGSYKVKLPDKKGKYLAAAFEAFRDSFNLCGFSQTKVVGHKH